MRAVLQRHRLALIIGLVILVTDQITKWLVLVHVAPIWPIKITEFFNLVLVWNTGVSFGMFNDGGDLGRWLLIGLALIISGMVARWLYAEQSRFMGFAYVIIIAGAIGNVIDRIRFGAVVDFLDVHVGGYHWPAFNVADSAIVIGALLIAFNLFTGDSSPDNAGEQSRGS